MRACCPCLIVHQIFIIPQTTVTAQYYWQGRGKQGRKSKLPQVVTKLLKAAICRDLQKEFVANSPSCHISQTKWILTRKLSIRLRYFGEVKFFLGPKLSYKVCFFRRDYLFQTFFSSQMESLLGLVSVEGDGNDPCQVFSLVVILLSLFYSEDVFWLVHPL